MEVPDVGGETRVVERPGVDAVRSMVELAAGQLVVNAVKAAYDLWKDNKGASVLELTDGAKALLKLMQSDDTGHGITAVPLSPRELHRQLG